MTVPGIPESLRRFCTDMAPLWPLTSMRVGGPARWLAQPQTEDDVQLILGWIEAQSLPVVILGGGTNVLFPDDGFAGVVVLTKRLKGARAEGLTVTAMCGEPLSDFARRLDGAGLSGMEWACGIPGTVGGAVVMNAGTANGDIASVLSSVRLLTSQGLREMTADELQLGYRTSALLNGEIDEVVLDATFTLREEDHRNCERREREALEDRRRTQPTGASCGCIFKNPATGPSAGELLDRAGCKGMRIGAASVSELHANFILNEGTNNANDVFGLIEVMREHVIERQGIVLQQEVKIITQQV